MKTFIASLVIFALLCVFVGVNSAITSKSLYELINLTESLPDSTEEFNGNYEFIRADVEKLFDMWDKKIDKFSYIMSYDMLDRADDAALSLYSAYLTGDAEDFVLARMKLSDCLKRLKVLCGFGIKSFA